VIIAKVTGKLQWRFKVMCFKLSGKIFIAVSKISIFQLSPCLIVSHNAFWNIK